MLSSECREKDHKASVSSGGEKTWCLNYNVAPTVWYVTGIFLERGSCRELALRLKLFQASLGMKRRQLESLSLFACGLIDLFMNAV